MTKKNNAIICAICTFFAIVLLTCISTTSAHAESVSDVTDKAVANNGVLFLVGNDAEEIQITSVSEVVKSVKEQLLTSSFYVQNSSIVPVTDSTRIEFVNQFGYCDPQTITLYEDVVTYEAKLLFERPYSNTSKGYFMYIFDKVYAYEEAEQSNDIVKIFNYYGFEYYIYVQDDQFRLAKKWLPEENSHVYECDETNELAALVRKLKEAFTEGSNIVFIEENCNPPKVHAFVNNKGQKEEFIFSTYNARPVNSTTEIIASIDTIGDTYTIYVTDGVVAVDSARRSASIDFPKSKKVG